MKKVLIIEDNKSALEYLSCMVSGVCRDTKVFSMQNVKEACQCALDKTIDLFMVDIILDTSKPGDSSGLKFIDRIRQIGKYAFTPVIFISSLEDPKLYTYEKLHCYSYLEKPFDTEKVKKLVLDCLKFPENNPQKKTLYFRKDGIIFAVNREDMIYAEPAYVFDGNSVNHCLPAQHL